MAGLNPKRELPYMTDAQFRWEVSHVGRIDMLTFQWTIGTLFAVALLLFSCRISIRLYTRRRLYLDDGFLILAVGCLCASTAIVFQHCFAFFLASLKIHAPRLLTTTAFAQHKTELRASEVPRDILAVTSWTAIYAIKFCFFACFRPLIAHLRGLTIWFWISVIFSLVAWVFSAFKGFIFPNLTATTPSFAFTIALALADIVADIMIISIPFLLLRKSTLKLSTKMSVGAFLGLSVLMIICSIIRSAGFVSGKIDKPDPTWRMLWTQIECCVAVIMASLTAMRAVLFPSSQQSNSSSFRRKQYYKLRPWTWSRSRTGSSKNQSDKENSTSGADNLELPAIPSATFSGVRTFIRRNQRDEKMATTYAESVWDPLEADYHYTIRK
ncbi:hypothetical protein BDV95DRAFT_289806 [Massariosphaeria phaeospora]|uniref:Rhodopsin domain-containing protein n=1 Tax=Massariosphaeria phaeospora TaxID=100035 RepID=A0A7C8M637_9PLEO|nr:hypothetical protein BDV95DRAFT_289806 [Massariosphaeria phaeospora]